MIDFCEDALALRFLSRFYPSKVSADIYEKFICYKSDDIVGVISYGIIYERAEINYIAVDNNHRGKGIGNKLVNKAIDDIINCGCFNVTLEVAVDNLPAINLYLKNGFVKEAIRKNYYEGIDGILMGKEL